MTSDVAGSAAPTLDGVGAAPASDRRLKVAASSRAATSWVLALLLGIPLAIHVFLVWVPTLALDRAVVHALERDRRPRPDQVRRDRQLPRPGHHLPAVLAGDHSTT